VAVRTVPGLPPAQDESWEMWASRFNHFDTVAGDSIGVCGTSYLLRALGARRSQEARVAVRRSTVKRTVGPALYRVMEPGDQIIAGTRALTGPTPWLEMLGTVPIVFAVAGFTTDATFQPFGVLLVNLALLALPFMRRPVFVAVTQRQLICYRLSRMNDQPVRLLFCAPLLSTRMTYLGRSAPRWRSIRYDGPGAESRSLRLNVAGRWRRDLDEVLAALQAQGGGVEGLSSAQAMALGQIFP
jgi:hypothetical protein